jgi:hypothetical protein
MDRTDLSSLFGGGAGALVGFLMSKSSAGKLDLANTGHPPASRMGPVLVGAAGGVAAGYFATFMLGTTIDPRLAGAGLGAIGALVTLTFLMGGTEIDHFFYLF